MAAPRPCWQLDAGTSARLTDAGIEQGERLLAGIHGLSFLTPSPPRTPSPRPLQKLRSRPRVPPARPASPQDPLARMLGDHGSSVPLPLSGRRRGYWSPRWEPLQPACTPPDADGRRSAVAGLRRLQHISSARAAQAPDLSVHAQRASPPGEAAGRGGLRQKPSALPQRPVTAPQAATDRVTYPFSPREDRQKRFAETAGRRRMMAGGGQWLGFSHARP